MTINLIVQYFKCDNDARQKEIDTCLQNNLLNEHIDAVHLLTEAAYDFSVFNNYTKIVQTVIGERLTYNKAFEYTNSVSDDAIWLLSNADIYFDESLKHLRDVDLENVVYALSRHEVQHDGSNVLIEENYAHGSQDTWVFSSPINIVDMWTDFYLGIPGCDNRIAYEFLSSGYILVNPAKIIKCYHFDLTRETQLEKRTGDYDALNNSENIKAGKIAPPPYQFYIYPTDCIELGHVDAYKKMQKKLFDMTNLTTELNSLYQQVTDLHNQVSDTTAKIYELDNHVLELDQLMAERNLQIAERDQQILSYMNSLSWKLTLPLRMAIDFIKIKK